MRKTQVTNTTKNKNKTKLIVVVQDRPTQFDMPFYALHSIKGSVNLRVLYTQVDAMATGLLDEETGEVPRWDHITHITSHNEAVTFVKGVSLRATVQCISQMHPDLVIVCGYMPARHAMLALLLKYRGIRVGLRSDNTLIHSKFTGLKGLIKSALLPFWLRLYDSWHPVGTLASEYLQKLARTSRPVFLFPYSVDNEWFQKLANTHRTKRDAWRKHLGWNADDFVVLGVMKWHPREDPLTLLDGFEKLLVHQTGARLILVGDGPLRTTIAKRLSTLQGHVHAPGYVSYSELPRLYAMSDVFVHPAVGEPWGVSVNEAMACGLPVLAAAGVGAGRDLIVEGQTGFVFADGNSQQLAEQLVQLARHTDLRQYMGEQCVEHMKEWNYGHTHDEMAKAVYAA
jgi:glycosyltransferase involved in cell wall biosynthesis